MSERVSVNHTFSLPEEEEGIVKEQDDVEESIVNENDYIREWSGSIILYVPKEMESRT